MNNPRNAALPDPTAKGLTEALSGGRWDARRGRGRALCPAHDDNEPSLDIADKNGKTLFVCRAGCTQDAVTDALRAKGVWPAHKPNGCAKPQRTIVATYEYADAIGELIFQVVRYHPRAFKQRQPDGKRGWIWSITDLDPRLRYLPYRLPELIEAIAEDKPVLIVEGEKDVEAARKLGITATCNAEGATKWREEHARHLKGANVIVIPDNDEQGRKHAAMVTRSLKGIAKRVRLLALPGVPKKGDLSDWIEEGGDAEKLWELIELITDANVEALQEAAAQMRGEPYQPDGKIAHLPSDRSTNPSEDEPLGEWDAGDDTEPIPPRGWLLGNSLCRGFVSSLLGDGGTGKTAIRYAQAMSLAGNRPLTGEHIFQRCRVLIVSLEDGRDELRRRVKAARIHHGIESDALRGWLFLKDLTPADGKLIVPGDPSPLAARFERTIRERQIDFVLLDPFVKTHPAPENDNTAIDMVVQILADMCVRLNVAIDVPHHMAKGPADPGNANRGRGASAMKDAARLVRTVTQMSPEEARCFEIEESERRFLVRVDDAKLNIAPMGRAKWFRLVGVNLGNATPLYPNGDNVQTVERWTPPDLFEGVNIIATHAILDDIQVGLGDGVRYSGAKSAGKRAAWRVVVRHAPDTSEARARQIIKAWLDSGLLYVREYDDPEERKKRQGLYVDETKRPSR